MQCRLFPNQAVSVERGVSRIVVNIAMSVDLKLRLDLTMTVDLERDAGWNFEGHKYAWSNNATC